MREPVGLTQFFPFTEALSKGWALYGSPTLTFDPEQKRVICGQAVTKDVEDLDYSPDMKLSEA